MKKFLLIISVLTCCIGCKSYTPSMSEPDNLNLPNKLSGLSFSNVDTAGITIPSWLDYPKDYFRLALANQYINDDINQNYIAQSSNKNGKLEITCMEYDIDNDMNWHVVSVIPIFYPYYVFTLFGAPVQKHEATLKYRFSIKDKYENTIWRKIYKYEEETKIGLYYGKTRKRLAIDGAKDIMKQFKKDYENDFKIISEALNNPLSPAQLASMPPATIYLMNHLDMSTLSQEEKTRREEEILYVEVNGKHIADIKANTTLKLIITAGDVAIKIYKNHSNHYYEKPDKFYNSYEEAKAQGARLDYTLCRAKSGEQYYYSIEKSNEWHWTNEGHYRNLKLSIIESSEREHSLSPSVLAKSEKNVVAYNMRDSNQKLITISSQKPSQIASDEIP